MIPDSDDRIDEDGTALPNRSEVRVVADVPRESLKSLFYIIAGKPDSLYKLFNGPILVKQVDLNELNKMVCEKLAHFEMMGSISAVTVNHDNGIIKEFSSWDDFERANWAGPEVTEGVSLRWDFLAKLPSYNMPQRHTATVRIARDPTPLHMMQTLFSQDPEDIDNLDRLFSPVVCRVDFINGLLAQEFINIVNRWHKGRRKPISSSSMYSKLMRHRRIIEEAIRYSIPIAGFAVAVGVLNTLFHNSVLDGALTVKDFQNGLLWLLGVGGGIAALSWFGRMLSGSTIQALIRTGRTSVFQLTNGDLRAEEELAEKRRKSGQRFIAQCGLAIVLDLAAGLIAQWLF